MSYSLVALPWEAIVRERVWSWEQDGGDDASGYAAGAPLRAPLLVPGLALGPGGTDSDADPLLVARHTIIRSKSNITNN